MYALGIINGAEVNGRTVFDPDGILTRAQGVTMIGRPRALQNEQGDPAEKKQSILDAARKGVEHLKTMQKISLTAMTASPI